jgi:hypothetical protein
LTTRLKSKTYTNPQKEPGIHTDKTTDSPKVQNTCIYKFLTSLTQYVEKTVNLLHGFKYINQEICMYYSVNVDHNSMVAHLIRSGVMGFLKRYISNGMDGTNNETLWNGYEEHGNV